MHAHARSYIVCLHLIGWSVSAALRGGVFWTFELELAEQKEWTPIQDRYEAFYSRWRATLHQFKFLQKSYQDECFTPKRNLARTPPAKKQQEKETENISPNVTQEAPLVKDKQQNQAAVKVDKTRKVQNSSSTAKHVALKRRSTHAIADEQGKKKDSLVNIR